MNISEKIIRKHWELAAEEQISKNYRDKGYKVSKHRKIDGFTADVVAEKGNEFKVVEVVSGKWSKEKARQINSMRNHVVHKIGGSFELVWVNPPKEVSVSIEGLKDALEEEIRDKNYGDLDALSTHTQIDEISEIELSNVTITDNEIEVEGTGTISVELNYGSEHDRKNDNGATLVDSYSFGFKVTVDSEINIQSVEYINIDTSDFYK